MRLPLSRRYRWPISILLWWGSFTLLLSACGAATRPAGVGAAEEPPATDHDDPVEPGDDQVAPERTPECFAQCRELIEDAEALLRQAGALKGAAKASVALHRRAGAAFVRAWRGCDLTLPRGEDLDCAGGRDVVANMVKSFAAADAHDRLLFAYLVALDTRWRVEGSSLAQSAADELARLAALAAQQAQADPQGKSSSAMLAARSRALVNGSGSSGCSG